MRCTQREVKTLAAQEGGEQQRRKVAIWGQQRGNEPLMKMAAKGDQELPAVRMRVLERSETGVARWSSEIPFQWPVTGGVHGIRA